MIEVRRLRYVRVGVTVAVVSALVAVPLGVAAEERSAGGASGAAASDLAASRSAFRGQSRDEALVTARRHHRGSVSGPVWAPLRGVRVERYLGPRSALVETGEGRPGLVESTLPLRAQARGGELAPVDLSLVAAGGGWRSSNPLVDVRIGRRLGEGVRFERTGVAVGAAGARADEPVLSEDRVFWANAFEDTDVWVTPQPTGFELFAQLRSPAAPERIALEFSLPAGARLRLAARGESAEVVRGDERLAALAPPAAWDAEGTRVEVGYELEGDRLALVIGHRERDLLYPVLVDPYTSDGLFYDSRLQLAAGPDHGRDGWYPVTSSPPPPWHECGGAGLTACFQGGFSHSAGRFIGYAYKAPGTAYIYRAEFTNVFYAAWGDGSGWDSLTEGIYDPASATWQAYKWEDPVDGTYEFANRWVTTAGQSGDWKRHCVRANCAPPGGSSGNEARATITTGSTAPRESWSSQLFIRGAEVYMDDPEQPWIGAPFHTGLPGGWTASATPTVTATITDPGLGVKRAVLTVPNSTGGTQQITAEHPCQGIYGDRCPQSWTPGMSSPNPPRLSYTTDTMPEGINTLELNGQDLLAHVTPTPRTWQIKIDRTPPDIYAGGTLWRDGATLAGPSYDLTVEAADGDSEAPNSGVASITVKVDGQAVPPVAPPQACSAADNCSLEAEWVFSAAEYSEGSHTITVIAVDRAGISSEESVVVDVEHIPTLPPSTKALESVSGLRVDGAAIGDEAGSAVATLGDVNGDGVDDFAIGAPHADNNARPESGSVYVIYGGGPGGTLDLASLGSRGYRIDGAFPGHMAGTAVAAAGDLNGDGLDDMLVGAPHLGGNQGHVYAVFGGTGTGLDLSSLGGRGFIVHGPAADQPLLPGERRFGSSLAGVRGGFGRTFGDVNGDELDDFVVGSSSDGLPVDVLGYPIFGVHAGAAYVIFGKTNTGTVNVGSLQSNAGFPIHGAATGHRAGHSAAVVGDVNADNLADIAVTAPGANHLGRIDGGRAYLVFGKQDGQRVDLATFGPSAGFPIHGAAGDRLGSSVASAGDVNNDGYDDIAIGGHGATVVLGKGFDADPVDAAAMTAVDGYRIVAPAGSSYDEAVVSNAEDLNGDALPDLGVGFPAAAGGGTATAGENYLLFTQRGAADEPLAAVTDLGSPIPGQLGTRLHGSQQAQSAGIAVDGYDGGDGGTPGLLVGAPGSSANTRPRSGSVYYVPQSQASAHGRANTKCRRRSAYTYNDYKVDSPECRRTDAGNKDHQPWPSVCGANDKEETDNCAHGNVGEFHERRAVAYEPFRKPLRTDVATGEAEVNRPGIGTQRAWPLYDSVGEVVGYIRQTRFRPRQFAVWNDQKQYIGETHRHSTTQKVRWILESRGCINPKSDNEDAGDYAIVFLEANDGSHDTRRGGLSIRAFISRRAFQPHSFWPDVANDEGIDYYWTPCGIRRFPKRRSAAALQTTTTYSVPQLTVWNQEAGTGDAYQSHNAGTRCEQKQNRAKFPEGQYTAANMACGAPYQNNTWPHGSDPVRYPPIAMMPGGTNAVRQGGLARAIFKVGTNGTSVRLRDRIRYIDPNVPCGHYRVANWQVIRLPDGDGDKTNDIFGWAIRRVGDNQAPAAPASPPGPRQC